MSATTLSNVYKVQWHEGMLLSPQHFQYSEQRIEQLLYTHLVSNAYSSWGIIELEIDKNFLHQGIVEISHIFAIFPDGTVIFQGSNDVNKRQPTKSLRYNLNDLAQKNAGEITLYLCLYQKTDSKKRYESIEYPNVMDENSSDNVINLPILEPKIFLGAEIPNECIGFPIVKLSFDGKQFSPQSFLPASLSLPIDHPIKNTLAEIILNLRQKTAYLVNKSQQTTSPSLSRETTSTLKSLISTLCILEPIATLDKLHPERLFDHLINAAAHLLPLQTTHIPGILPSYNHFNPADSIGYFLKLFEKTISSIQQRYLSIPFHQQDRLFYLHLHPNYLIHDIHIGFRCPPGMSEKQMHDWVQEAIICSDEKIEPVTTRRISGAHRTLLNNDELGDLIPNPGTLIFTIKKDDEFIKIKNNLNIFNPGDNKEKRPLDVTLFVSQNDS